MNSKWTRHKIKTFPGDRDFFLALKWHERQLGPFWGQKSPKINHACVPFLHPQGNRLRDTKVPRCSKWHDIIAQKTFLAVLTHYSLLKGTQE
jgi:hypothetical protein